MEQRIEVDIPILGKVSVNFEGLSAKLFRLYLDENEVQRQKDISHLGLISEAFNGISHTRFDYLILQSVISELVENNFKGTANAQGTISINSVSYSGNDIIKSWILLSNFGHCKNTIGDEKAILLNVIQRRGFRSYLISTIKDIELKNWAQKIIDTFDYVNFHHILSIRRIYKTLGRRGYLQKELITVYKLFLLESDKTKNIANTLKVEQLKITHKNIRDLSILALDSRNTSLPFSIDILPTILSFNFYENRYQQTKISDIFNPMLSLLYDTLYLHPKSQTIQRSYEIKALEKMTLAYNDIIDEAMKIGLSNPKENTLVHFLRIELHTDYLENINIIDSIRSLLTVRREIRGVDASLDYNPLKSRRVLDFYLQKNVFNTKYLPKFLSNITSVLEKQFLGTMRNHIKSRGDVIKAVKTGMEIINLNDSSKETLINTLTDFISTESWKLVQSNNIPTFKEILWSVLRYFIKDQYYFDIDHHVSKSYEYFGVRFDNGMDLLNNNVQSAIDETSDVDRKHELIQLQKSTTRKFNGTTIACLLRVTVYDYSKAPKDRTVTDIDSIVLKYCNNSMILELHESKNTKNPFKDAKKDLNKKLIKILNNNSKGFRIKEVKNFGAKVVLKM
jgi:hypothetical protein